MRSTSLPPELATIAREATRNGNMRAPARTARILGLGHHVPPEVVPNGPIAERIGVDDAWIVKRTGIKSRRRALPDERLTDYADQAVSQINDGETGDEAHALKLVSVAARYLELIDARDAARTVRRRAAVAGGGASPGEASSQAA